MNATQGVLFGLGRCKRCACPCDAELCVYCSGEAARLEAVAEREEAELAAGLMCPACGGRDLPVWSTRRRMGRVVRVRRCRNCLRKVTTFERIN